jgi:hypothetical protein
VVAKKDKRAGDGGEVTGAAKPDGMEVTPEVAPNDLAKKGKSRP